jgi:hypothetical protein
MALKGIFTALGRTVVMFSAFVPNNLIHLTSAAFAEDQAGHCVAVGGALMTNIGAIAGVTNLGPVFGDLAGSVAATIPGANPGRMRLLPVLLGMRMSGLVEAVIEKPLRKRRYVAGDVPFSIRCVGMLLDFGLL